MMGLVCRLGAQRQTSTEWCCVVAEIDANVLDQGCLILDYGVALSPMDGAIFKWQSRVGLGKRSGCSWKVRVVAQMDEQAWLTDS